MKMATDETAQGLLRRDPPIGKIPIICNQRDRSQFHATPVRYFSHSQTIYVFTRYFKK
jgi:hypothetical protein